MILEPQVILEFRCKLEALITEREGMLQNNRDREWRDETPPYDGDQFYVLSEKIKELGEELVVLGERHPTRK